MDTTSQFLGSLERVLKSAPSIIFKDDFLVLNIKIESLTDGLATLKNLLAEQKNGTLEYQLAAVQVAQKGNDLLKIPHYLRRNEDDILLTPDLLERDWLCTSHKEEYENNVKDQTDNIELDRWRRYSLIQSIVDCPNCNVSAWVVVAFDKAYLESQIKNKIQSDIPQLSPGLENIGILYWADFSQFYTLTNNNPRQIYTTIANLSKPCLFVCLEHAENDGSDYFKSLATHDFIHQEKIEPILTQLIGLPPLQSISNSRKSHFQEYPESFGYIPPEYWLSAPLLAHAQTGNLIPIWLIKIAPLLVYSLLASISSTTKVDNNKIGFEIKREFDLRLNISINDGTVEIIKSNNLINKVSLTQEITRKLLNFFGITLQGKYSSVNQDLVQRSIVYGTNFIFDDFFYKLDRVIGFYEFEYKHLLGDRFEQQSRTLNNFISGMMGLRQQLASLIESLTNDLSGLSIAILATTALSIVAKVIDINTWNNLLIYGMATSFIFVYFYITVFLLRIDNLKSLGIRAVDGFIKDVERGQRIWDFPLHSIGVEEIDLDRDMILKPLVGQFKINQLVGEVAGILAHILFISLAISLHYWWVPIPTLVINIIFLIWSISIKNRKPARIIYYSLTLIITIFIIIASIMIGLAYWLFIP